METPKHTPGPWRTSESPHRREWAHWLMAGDATIGAICELGNIHPAPGIADANAEYIVRACNNHDDLLVELKTLLSEYIMALPENRRDTFIVERVSAAIAKATE